MVDEDKKWVIVLAVVEGDMSVSEAARRFSVSRDSIHRWIVRYRADGLDGLINLSRAPRTSPTRTSQAIRQRILELRSTLTTEGLDAGAESIHDRLLAQDITPPSLSTIWRILRQSGTVTPQPHKRPRSSWTRFESPAPNGCWQSDMTHWRLSNGHHTEIITWLDDHSRKIMHISAHRVVSVQTVTETFLSASQQHGLPASTLTDNGMIFTTRFARGDGGPNRFEHTIKQLGITQKNGHPGHPQTQGKIERFHQTLKKWLTAQPAASTITDLQQQLDAFTTIYNDTRPHRALGRRTPSQAYQALPKTGPTIELLERHWRVRHDTVDTSGVVTLRWAGKLRHLGIGRAHTGARIVLLVAGNNTIVVRPDTGEIIAEHTLNPNHDYHPKNREAPPEEGA